MVAMVGGGQLSRMTHQAAIALGQSLRVLAAEPNESAALVVAHVQLGDHRWLADVATGELGQRRRAQQVRWSWRLVRDGLEHRLRAHPGVRAAVPELERAVLAGELTPAPAAQQIVGTFLG